jgi:hypothetical protein
MTLEKWTPANEADLALLWDGRTGASGPKTGLVRWAIMPNDAAQSFYIA